MSPNRLAYLMSRYEAYCSALALLDPSEKRRELDQFWAEVWETYFPMFGFDTSTKVDPPADFAGPPPKDTLLKEEQDKRDSDRRQIQKVRTSYKIPYGT